MNKENTIWRFVEEHYPNYSSSDEIAQEGDLHKLVNDEYDDGDCASDLLNSEYEGNIKHPMIYKDWQDAYVAILESAIIGYQQKQQ